MTSMSRRPRRLQTLLLVGLLLASAFGGVHLSGRAAPSSAQADDSSASWSPDRIDLAAIVVDAADLPDGARLVSERYIPVDELIARTFGPDEQRSAEFETVGLLGFYESTYELAGSDVIVRSYAEAYEDASGAERGFSILEDETGLFPDNAMEDSPIPGVESDQGELTEVDADVGGGFRIQIMDATVRQGRVIAGVALENLGGSDAPDRGMVLDLIERVTGRIEPTERGSAVPGRDGALPAGLLQASAGDLIVLEGYLAPAEILPVSLDTEIDTVQSAYGRTTGVRFGNAPEAPPVLFTNLVRAEFADAESAERVLYGLDDLALPSLIPPPSVSYRQQATTAAISGVDAFSETWRAFLPGGPIDSVRLGFAIGSRLAIVEVVGAANVNGAHDAAVVIAEAQRNCMEAGGQCSTTLPIGEIQELALIEGELPPVIEDADPDRQATFDAVWNEINEDYLYRTGRQYELYPNYHELDWAAARVEYEAAALDADTDEEFYQTVAAMVDELGDQHTGFLSPDDTEINAALFAGELMYAGIGVDLSGADLILQVFPESPADRAGLQRRDRIEAVDGEPLPFDDLLALREVVERVNRLLTEDQLPDEVGGTITLTVRSPGEAAREVEVERATGPAPIVPSGFRLPNEPDIGYLLVPDFVTPDLQDRVLDILEEMLEEGELDGLILDLRSNPGGSVALLETFLGLFVEGEVGTFYYRDGTLPESIRVQRQRFADELDDVPLVVLTDDRMYSASEVATAILQDEGRATVVGVTSPGDVEVLLQSTYPDGSSLYIVLGLFVLPGQQVEGVGNVPDVPVLLDWTRYSFDEDPQILAGIETIREGSPTSR